MKWKHTLLRNSWIFSLSFLLIYTVDFCVTDAESGSGTQAPPLSFIEKSKFLQKPGDQDLHDNNGSSRSTSLTPDPLSGLVLISTLDGSLTAVDALSGQVRWVSKDEPMLRVPTDGPHSSKAPYFLPDPKSGALYVMGKKNQLRKLPFTIPQLVAMAPCKNSEGLMYTGKKTDAWLSLNPYTGQKLPIVSHTDSICPAKATTDEMAHENEDEKPNFPAPTSKNILMGKTEYTLSMHEGLRNWNLTYHAFSAAEMAPEMMENYEWAHFSSPSSGLLLTYDRKAGQLKWQLDLGSPAVALYVIEYTSSNLISVPFSPIASETLDRLKSVAGSQVEKPLSSTTYVGEGPHGLYAVSTLVDEEVLLISTQSLPLLEGPVAPEADRSGEETDFLLLGYYAPEKANANIMQIESNSNNIVSPPTDNSNGNESNDFLETSNATDPLKPLPITHPPVTPNKIPFFPTNDYVTPAKNKQSGEKPFKIVFTTAAITVIITSLAMLIGYMVYTGYFRSEEKSVHFASGSSTESISQKISSSDGTEVTIGKICFDPSSILGKGCEGTFVFKGKFEDRDVAVKRILPECFAFADREVDLLKESDQHVNVIRYFCTETDGQFRYIALELCMATLSDWVDGKFQEEVEHKIDPIRILKEATEGLAHLHSLRIVHRDIKPANVLLTVSGSNVRTVISDFGLCKKLANGKTSFSRRSGGFPGTEGWVAPEILKNLKADRQAEPERMTCSVDIFSLGCVYYYVLTKGDHPFGDHFQRQSNIINAEYNVHKIEQNPQGVAELVTQMISSRPRDRPPLESVLCHPMFWSQEKILSFFLDVSDRVEKETEESCRLLRNLETDGFPVVREDWREHICPEVAMDLRKYRTYKGTSVRDLLRAMRNKKNHYRELTPEAQASLGQIPNEFVSYWLFRFPLLLPHVWMKFERAKVDPIFQKYYSPVYNFSNEDFDDEEEEEDDKNKNFLDPKDLDPKGSPQKKLGKNFWRSRNQYKANKWKQRQSNNTFRDKSPNNNMYHENSPYGDNVTTGRLNNVVTQTQRRNKSPIPASVLDDNWRKPAGP